MCVCVCVCVPSYSPYNTINAIDTFQAVCITVSSRSTYFHVAFSMFTLVETLKPANVFMNRH